MLRPTIVPPLPTPKSTLGRNVRWSTISLVSTWPPKTNCVGPPLTPACMPPFNCAYAGVLISAIPIISPSAQQNRRVIAPLSSEKRPVDRARDTPKLWPGSRATMLVQDRGHAIPRIRIRVSADRLGDFAYHETFQVMGLWHADEDGM